MCGILGILNLREKLPIDEHRFRQALTTLRHRGPDAEVARRISDDVMLGHARLSIIDMREVSNQPLKILGRYWIVYNGEIYNYKELRIELEQRGAIFQTDGDTEVLLYAYAFWGTSCVERFNGMWAFAIYDARDGILFCSRDRFGVKPFNYTIERDQFLFASEIKALLAYRPCLAEPDFDAISNYCRTSVGAQSAQTWFKQVRRLPPGCNLLVSDGTVRIQRYWRYPTGLEHGTGFDEAKKHYLELFQDAVRLRMRSDVPVGITLSSGIDSTSIAYMMAQVHSSSHHSFTSRFVPEDKLETDCKIYTSKMAIDESVIAKEVADALGYQSHVVNTDYTNFIPALDRIIYHLESGNSSPAVIPLMQLLGVAKGYVTVLLDGQGADELLGGYIVSTFWPAIADLLSQGRFSEARRSLKEFSKTYKVSYAVQMALRNLSNDIDLVTRIHQKITGRDAVFGPVLSDYTRWKDFMDRPGEGNSSSLGQILQRQHAGGMINLLHYGDAISMANSLEARMPFLDYRLVEYVWRLPSEHKVHLATGKYIHREAMRGAVPDKILDQKAKFGFNTPVTQWFRSQKFGKDHPLDLLLEHRSLGRGLFTETGTRRMIYEHRSGRADHATLLFRMLNVELWFRRFIDAPIAVQPLEPSSDDV